MTLKERKGPFWRAWRWWISQPSSPFTGFLADEVREIIKSGKV